MQDGYAGKVGGSGRCRCSERYAGVVVVVQQYVSELVLLPGMKWNLRLLELVVFRWSGGDEVGRSCCGVDVLEGAVCVRGCVLYELALGYVLCFNCGYG